MKGGRERGRKRERQIKKVRVFIFRVDIGNTVGGRVREREKLRVEG